jgi:hypothetical protein
LPSRSPSYAGCDRYPREGQSCVIPRSTPSSDIGEVDIDHFGLSLLPLSCLGRMRNRNRPIRTPARHARLMAAQYTPVSLTSRTDAPLQFGHLGLSRVLTQGPQQLAEGLARDLASTPLVEEGECLAVFCDRISQHTQGSHKKTASCRGHGEAEIGRWQGRSITERVSYDGPALLFPD